MPRLDVSVWTGARAAVALAVARGEADIALTDGLTAPGDPLTELAPVTASGVSQTGVAVIVPAGHPLAARRALRLPDLADSRWIEAEQVAPPLAEIRRHAGVDGFRAAFRYAGSDLLSLIRLAAAGHGLTLLPETALSTEPAAWAGVTPVPVTAPRVVHRIELIHGTLRESSPAAELAAILSKH